MHHVLPAGNSADSGWNATHTVIARTAEAVQRRRSNFPATFHAAPLLSGGQTPLEPMESVSISIAFWGTLFLAVSLFAVFALAPRLYAFRRLAVEWETLESNRLRLEREVQHFARVRDAIDRDPEFLQRLARNELAMTPQGGTQIQVARGLVHDARIPQLSTGLPLEQSRAEQGVVALIAESPTLRWRLAAASAVLFLVAFLFLNEDFFSGQIGRRILQMMSKFFQRYRVET